MTHVGKVFVCTLTAALSLTGPAVAQQSQRDPAPQQDQVAKANQGTVGVITGMEGGTYARTGADLTILDDQTLRVVPSLGKGSLQNLSDILFLKGVDIGFVQSDVVPYAIQHNMFPGLAQRIRYIAKLYDEEVHVLARADIKKIEDLDGQRVNVDVLGSGSAITAEVLLNSLGIKAHVEHAKQVDAVEALKRGDIAAIFQVAGAPMPLLTSVTGQDGLHLLPIALTPALAQTYLPDQLTHESYPALIQADAPIPTIAVGDVMAVYAWPSDTDRYRRVSHFVDAFFSKFDEFQQAPRHPKWREVNLTAEAPGWTRFQAAQDWLMRQTTAGNAGAATQAQFDLFLSQTNAGVAGKLSDPAKQALFQQFLTWNRQHMAGP